MEHYYFIEKKGTKQGPYKLAELKQQTIYFDELIWRSDNDEWKKAADFEELKDVFIVKPPPTPKEQKVAEVNKSFTNQIIGQIAIFYVITSIIVGFISFAIAQSSWETYLKETGGKYLGNNYSSSYSSGMISYAELYANKRYPYYMPGTNNESSYGSGQGFLFRPFKAFGSTIYLTKEEQDSSGTLLINLMLSSFVSLSFIFVFIGIVYYAIKRSSIETLQKEVNQTAEASKN